MYCRNCGEIMNDNQSVCIKCGVPVGKGNNFCTFCGGGVATNAVICKSCGRHLNPINNKSINENTFDNTQYKRRIALFHTILATLITIFLLIPAYFTLESSYGKYIWEYSFVEWMEEESIIVLLLLWVNPLISYISIKKEKNFSVIKIIDSILLVILILSMSIDTGDGYGIMFFLTILLLISHVTLSILEPVFLIISNNLFSKPIENNFSSLKQKSTTTNDRMFCKNCGVEMNPNQAFCIKCGVSVGKGTSYCANCGNSVSENADFCIHCGVAIKNKNFTNLNSSVNCPREKTTIALICFFLGGFGVHNFMMGEKKKGYIKIALCFVFGISGLLALIEFVKILTDKYEVNPDVYF